MLPDPAVRRETADSLLAKNLVAARVLSGMTQRELASASAISRATIAQLETGYSDPRLSTVVDLATALGLLPIFLLIGPEEVRAVAALIAGDGPAAVRLPNVPPAEVARMRELVQTGMLKDRLRAARVGASVARGAGCASPGTAALAGILSAFAPGPGTAIGAALGEVLARTRT